MPGGSPGNAAQSHGINWLLNGGMNRMFRSVVYDEYDDGAVTGQPYSTYGFQVTADGGAGLYDSFVPVTIDVGGSAPQESLLANWFVSGTTGQLTLYPRDGLTGERVTAFTGPDPIRVSLTAAGEIVMTQDVPVFSHLLDRPVTIGGFLRKDSKTVDLQIEVDFGTTVVTSNIAPSSGYSLGGHVKLVTTPPFDATKFVVKLKLTGQSSASIYIGQFGIYLGNLPQLRFVEDLSEKGRPRGECAFYWGFPAPPGYKTLCEEDSRTIFHTAGDAQVDGLSASPFGGEVAHNHRAVTLGSDSNDNPKADGAYVLGRHHYHAVLPAKMDPLNFKVLVIEKI